MLLTEIRELDLVLKKHQALPLTELHGFLTAVLSGPTPISSRRWKTAARIPISESEEAVKITKGLTELCNFITHGLVHKTYEPLFVLKDKSTLSEVQFSISQWASGYSYGISLDIENWEPYIRQDYLSTLLFPIISFTLKDEDLSHQLHLLSVPHFKTELDLFRTRSVHQLPYLTQSVYNFWKAKRKDSLEEVHFTWEQRPLRQSPCPCGSRKKYEQCCLH